MSWTRLDWKSHRKKDNQVNEYNMDVTEAKTRTNDIPILLPRKLFVRNDKWTSLPRPQKPGYRERPSRELEGLIEGMIVLDDDRDLDCN